MWPPGIKICRIRTAPCTIWICAPPSSQAKKDGVSDKVLFDAINLVATVQGIVNRDKPRLYIDFIRNEYADVFEVDAAHAASQL